MSSPLRIAVGGPWLRPDGLDIVAVSEEAGGGRGGGEEDDEKKVGCC